MRLRRLEFAVIALTLAFICFMGGYFTGRKGAVNIVTIAPKQNETQNIAGAPGTSGNALPEQAQSGSAGSAGTSSEVPDSEGASGGTSSGTSSGAADSASEVQEQEQAPDTVGAPRGGDGKININLASQSELTDLPGIGNVLASRIVDYRRQHGDFYRIEDLRKVSGIGEKRYEAIQDKITVG